MGSTPLLLLCAASVIGATALLALWPASKHSTSSSAVADPLGLRRKLQHVTSTLLLLFLYLRAGVTADQASACLLVCAAGLTAVHLLRPRVPTLQRAYLAMFGSLMRPHERAGAAPGALFVLLGCGLCVALFGPAALPPHCDPSPSASATPWSLASLTGQPDIPALSILCLAVGDPLASLVGLLLGRRDRHRVCGGKSAWAAAIMAAVCATAAHALMAAMDDQRDTAALPGDCAALVPSAGWSALPCAQQLRAADLQRWAWATLAAVSASLFELFAPRVRIGSFRSPPLDDNLRIPLLTGAVLFACRAAGVLATTLRVAQQCAA